MNENIQKINFLTEKNLNNLNYQVADIDIDSYLQNKEIETKNIFYSKIKNLESIITEKQEEIKAFQEKYEKIKKDFEYNLSIIQERDQDLKIFEDKIDLFLIFIEEKDNLILKLQNDLELITHKTQEEKNKKDNEIDLLKFKLSQISQQGKEEAINTKKILQSTDMQKNQIKEYYLKEIENFKHIFEEEKRKQAEDFEKLKKTIKEKEEIIYDLKLKESFLNNKLNEITSEYNRLTNENLILTKDKLYAENKIKISENLEMESKSNSFFMNEKLKLFTKENEELKLENATKILKLDSLSKINDENSLLIQDYRQKIINLEFEIEKKLHNEKFQLERYRELENFKEKIKREKDEIQSKFDEKIIDNDKLMEEKKKINEEKNNLSEHNQKLIKEIENSSKKITQLEIALNAANNLNIGNTKNLHQISNNNYKDNVNNLNKNNMNNNFSNDSVTNNNLNEFSNLEDFFLKQNASVLLNNNNPNCNINKENFTFNKNQNHTLMQNNLNLLEDSLNTKINFLLKEKEDLKVKVNILTKENDGLNNILQMTENQIKIKYEEFSNLESALRNENEKLKLENIKKEFEIKNLDEKLTRHNNSLTESQIKQHRDNVEILENEITKLKKTLDLKIKEINKLKKEREKLSELCNSQRAEINRLENNLDLMNANKEYENLQDDVKYNDFINCTLNNEFQQNHINKDDNIIDNNLNKYIDEEYNKASIDLDYQNFKAKKNKILFGDVHHDQKNFLIEKKMSSPSNYLFNSQSMDNLPSHAHRQNIKDDYAFNRSPDSNFEAHNLILKVIESQNFNNHDSLKEYADINFRNSNNKALFSIEKNNELNFPSKINGLNSLKDSTERSNGLNIKRQNSASNVNNINIHEDFTFNQENISKKNISKGKLNKKSKSKSTSKEKLKDKIFKTSLSNLPVENTNLNKINSGLQIRSSNENYIREVNINDRLISQELNNLIQIRNLSKVDVGHKSTGPRRTSGENFYDGRINNFMKGVSDSKSKSKSHSKENNKPPQIYSSKNDMNYKSKKCEQEKQSNTFDTHDLSESILDKEKEDDENEANIHPRSNTTTTTPNIKLFKRKKSRISNSQVDSNVIIY